MTRSPFARRFLTLTLLTFFSACGVQNTAVSASAESEFANTGQGLATDSADHSCQVILRHIERVPGPGGYATTCGSTGPCFFQWQAVIDIASDLTAGGTVWLQYKSIDATTWSHKQAVQAADAPAGFQRYTVIIDTDTLNATMSNTALQRARLNVLPYLRGADGSRLFDHNRVTEDFATYALVSNNQWSIGEDANVCRSRGASSTTLQFKSNFTQAQHGPLLTRGKAVIEYDINRMIGCRGTHNGYPAWDTTAVVKFQPQGTTLERSVRGFDAPNGVPDISTLHSVPFEFTVPQGTQRIEMWFVNTGLWCSPQYDSNLGANYQFTVSDVAPAAVAWVGNGAASTSRNCEANIAIPEPIVLDGYIRERACSFLEMEAWVPGLTDTSPDKPEWLAARAELTLDGKVLPSTWLNYLGRSSNNYRYRFELPRDILYYGAAKWSELKYTLAFSTDGMNYTRDTTRTVRRDPTWCNPAWGSCN